MKEALINKVHCGDNVELMKSLPDNSIDMVITSPPYFGLRSYDSCAEKIWDDDKDCKHEWGISHTRHQEAPGKTSLVKQKGLEYTVTTNTCTLCGAWRGEFGLEPHPQMYIDHLVEICREIKRILKPSGSFLLNLGDSYHNGPAEKDNPWLQPKQLLLIPSRVACALQKDGWILRSDLLWAKPNPMPTPIKDRYNNTYEHIFFLTKKSRYFFDVDAVRIPYDIPEEIKSEIFDINALAKRVTRMSYEGKHKDGKTGSSSILSNVVTLRRTADKYIKEHELNEEKSKLIKEFYHSTAGNPLGKTPGDVIDMKRLKEQRERQKKHTEKLGARGSGSLPDGELINHPLGKTPGDIFEITVQPYAEAHFAVFPPELVRKPIMASCPERVCMNCGTPWTYETITKVEHNRENKRTDAKVRPDGLERVPNDWEPKQVLGQEWKKNCDCDSDYSPGIVLDPFNGSGTTCLVAKKLGRRFIGFDINSEYCKIAKKRISKYGNINEWAEDEVRNFDFEIKEFTIEKSRRHSTKYMGEQVSDKNIDWELP